jgi:murein DD-endopeptidase MepM/ murein hydrolase activator NlpD
LPEHPELVEGDEWQLTTETKPRTNFAAPGMFKRLFLTNNAGIREARGSNRATPSWAKRFAAALLAKLVLGLTAMLTLLLPARRYFIMPRTPNVIKQWFVERKGFGVCRVFVFLFFILVVVFSNTAGEPALMRQVMSGLLGGPEPVIKETASKPQDTPPLPAFDTLSAGMHLAFEASFGDPLILFGDTVGGAADPAGELLEWVAEAAEMITHTVLAGETIGEIARRYGVSAETILWSNNLTANSVIKPGDVLKFPSLSGVLHRVRRGETLSGIASAYRVSIERIQAANPGVSAVSLRAGDEIIIPGGRPLAVRRQAATVPAQEGSPLRHTSPGFFIMPTIGLNWARYHPVNATDIAAPCGTPVWAAASGVVLRTVTHHRTRDFRLGYGNLVEIAHPNGVRTLYSHLQTVLVQDGASVTQGEQIGTVGNTGRTHGPTGCHLHFEVRGGVNPFIRYR